METFGFCYWALFKQLIYNTTPSSLTPDITRSFFASILDLKQKQNKKKQKGSTSEISCITKIHLKLQNSIKAFTATSYSYKDTRRVLKLNITVLWSTIHSAEPQILNLEEIKSPSLTKQSTWPNKANSVLHKEYFYPIQHTYSKLHKAREKQDLAISTQHFSGTHMHLCKSDHNVNLLPEQQQQIIPKLWE